MINDQTPPGTLQMGSGEPIVLLHGVMGTPVMWRQVMPLLAARHHVIALAALGHQGGRPCSERPARIQHVIDDAERSLDVLGLDSAHLAGNSMGGWVALELSRRGRARSVCAFSPAGMWDGQHTPPPRASLLTTLQLTRATRWSLPFTSRFAWIRHLALRDSAVHGENTSRADLIALADAVLHCSAADDLLRVTEQFSELQVTCPTDVVWAAKDRIFPPIPFAENARRRVLGARHLMLEGVGHVPMLDNAPLVATTITNAVDRALERSVVAHSS